MKLNDASRVFGPYLLTSFVSVFALWNDELTLRALVPAVVAFAALLASTVKREHLSPYPNLLQVITSSLLIVVLMGFLFNFLATPLPFEKRGFLITFSLATIFSSGFFFVSFHSFLLALQKKVGAVLITILASSAGLLYFAFNNLLWRRLAEATATLTYYLAAAFKIPVTIDFTLPQGTLDDVLATQISTPHLHLNVWTPCSGVEGITLFIFVFSLILILDWDKLKKTAWFDIFLFGFIYMFIANVLRVTSILVAGEIAGGRTNSKYAQDLVVWLFHSYAGWAYYSAFLLIFIVSFYRWHREVESKEAIRISTIIKRQ